MLTVIVVAIVMTASVGPILYPVTTLAFIAREVYNALRTDLLPRLTTRV